MNCISSSYVRLFSLSCGGCEGLEGAGPSALGPGEALGAGEALAGGWEGWAGAEGGLEEGLEEGEGEADPARLPPPRRRLLLFVPSVVSMV